MKLGRGAVVVVELDPTIGHEQRGVRPCIVVSDPDVIGDQRFPLVCVVPVTGTPGEGLLYPPLAPGKSGLAKRSFADRADPETNSRPCPQARRPLSRHRPAPRSTRDRAADQCRAGALTGMCGFLGLRCMLGRAE